MAQVAMVLAAMGSFVSAMGQMQAGKAQQQAYQMQAVAAQRKANQEEYTSRERLSKLMSQQRALYAKAGVDISSGSPLLVLADTAAEGEIEAQAIRKGGKEEASLYSFYGAQAKKAGTIGAVGTLLTGIGKGVVDYYGIKKGVGIR